MNKTLVAFFSASGNTKRVAEKLAAAIDSDLYEIKPAVPYTSADLNWRDRHSRSSVEMNDPSSRPELADYHANIAGYDRIFLGFRTGRLLRDGRFFRGRLRRNGWRFRIFVLP